MFFQALPGFCLLTVRIITECCSLCIFAHFLMVMRSVLLLAIGQMQEVFVLFFPNPTSFVYCPAAPTHTHRYGNMVSNFLCPDSWQTMVFCLLVFAVLLFFFAILVCHKSDIIKVGWGLLCSPFSVHQQTGNQHTP